MAIYTNTMRMTGLSGIDTESMITALMKAEGMKLDRLKQQNQITQWKQTAYQSTAAIFKTFSNNFLSLGSVTSARLNTSYLNNTNTVKNANGTDSTAVKVTSSTNAQVGNYSMKINQLAQKDVYVSTTNASQGAIKGEAFNLSELKAGDSFNISLDGTVKTISFSAADVANLQGGSLSMEDAFNVKLSSAFGSETIGGVTSQKVAASVTGGKLEITTNKGHTAVITGSPMRDTAQTGGALNLIGLGLGANDTTFSLMVNGTNQIDVNINENSTANDIVQQIKTAIKADTGITNGLDVSLVTDENGDQKLKFSVGSTTEAVQLTDTSGGTFFNALGFSVGAIDIESTNILGNLGLNAGTSTKLNLSQTLAQTFGTAGDVSFTINDEVFTFSSDTGVSDMMREINQKNIGVTMSYDGVSETFKLASNNTGAVNSISFSDGAGGLLNSLGFTNTGVLGASQAQDAVFEFDGIETTRDSNYVDIGGLKMELTEVTTAPVTVNVVKNTSGALDFVKKFVDAYNTMLDGLNKELNTGRPKKDSYNYYEPLTEDQRSDMKDTDITNWETKAKTGLLYHDDMLTSISRSMRNMLYMPVALDDKPASDPTRRTISLFEIGITTSNNYNDGGKLTIDENKLRAALENRPEDVAELFTRSSSIGYTAGKNDSARLADEGIAERLNDIINNAIGSKGSITRKAGIEGDSFSEMSSTLYLTLKDQNEKIATMLTYLKEKETNYYSMFSKMEKAITEANNQMAYMQSQMGY